MGASRCTCLGGQTQLHWQGGVNVGVQIEVGSFGSQDIHRGVSIVVAFYCDSEGLVRFEFLSKSLQPGRLLPVGVGAAANDETHGAAKKGEKWRFEEIEGRPTSRLSLAAAIEQLAPSPADRTHCRRASATGRTKRTSLIAQGRAASEQLQLCPARLQQPAWPMDRKGRKEHSTDSMNTDPVR